MLDHSTLSEINVEIWEATQYYASTKPGVAQNTVTISSLKPHFSCSRYQPYTSDNYSLSCTGILHIGKRGKHNKSISLIALPYQQLSLKFDSQLMCWKHSIAL